MTLRRTRVALVLVAVVALSSAGCGGGAATQPDERPDGRLVLVSGHDDHGELREHEVAVYREAAQRKVVGRVVDGTLARVTAVEGQMLRVVTAEGESVRGWVDDFHLRGTLHLVGPAPTCRAPLSGSLQEPGMQVVAWEVRGGKVLVESVADPSTHGWVARDLVRELPPRGPGCGSEPHDAGHSH